MGDPAPLSPDDARILGLESDSVLGHTLKLLVLDPGTLLNLEAVRSRVLSRVASFPRALDRVEATGAGPAWTRAKSLDISLHVRRGPEAQTPADLREALGALMSQHLDRERPLWTVDLIGPLFDGREAIAVRIHHAMCDGAAAVRFIDSVLLDPHEEVAASAPPVVAASAPPVVAASAPPVIAAHRPPRWREWERLPRVIEREFGHPGSSSPFDQRITNTRSLAFADLSLADLRTIGHSRPTRATVNDVLLTVVGGGLRRWLIDRRGRTGSLPRLRAQVPVHMSAAGGDRAGSGNRDSFFNVDLAVNEPDDAQRLDQISARTSLRKRDHDAQLVDDLQHALDAIGPLGSLWHAATDTSREFAVAVSNVSGPVAAVSVLDRHVSHLYSSSEPAIHHALRIAAISNHAWLGVGFCVDPSAVDDVAALADATHDAFDALRSTL